MLRIARCIGAVALTISVAASALPARAQLPQEEPTEAAKEYPKTEIALYLWMPMVASKIDSSKGEVKSYISFSDLLSDLNGGLMLHGRSQLDEKWSVVGDFFWAHLRADNETKFVKLGPRQDIEVSAKLKAALGLWIVEGNAGYQLFKFGSSFSNYPSDTRKTRGEMYFGLRYYSVNPDMDVTVSSTIPALNGKRSIGSNQAWVDPVVGLRFGFDLSKTTQLSVMGDVGGFNIANGYCSEFSWSQTTMLSWNFAESWRLHMAYRFLDFKRDWTDKFQVQLRGPLVAVGYVF